MPWLTIVKWRSANFQQFIGDWKTQVTLAGTTIESEDAR